MMSAPQPWRSLRDAKVVVSADMDYRLNPPGKRCTANHTIPYLPRSYSLPAGLRTAPDGFPSRAVGPPQSGKAEVPGLRVPAERGFSRNIRTASTTSRSDLRADDQGEYNEAKHYWYHPAGKRETLRLADQKQTNSWAWIMHKARDHNGYGDDGLVDARDIQITAVSEDAPSWMIGTRTLPGPLSTKKHPVRRCPFVTIQGKKVVVQAKTYEQGPGLSALETLHPHPRPPPEAPILRAPRHDDMESKAQRCNLEFGGCQSKETVFPRARSNHGTFVPQVPPRRARRA